MWGLLVLAIAAAIGIVRGIVTGELGHTGVGWWEVVAQVFLLVAGGGLFAYYFGARRRDRALIAELVGHLEALRAGRAVLVGGRPVTLDTPVRHVRAVVSLVVISFKLPSRLHLDGEPMAGAMALAAATSLLLGWWGIPWGPIWTVQAFVRFARGGERQTVRDLLAR